MTDERRYWFRAKRYGWGWFPATWEGWIVLATFVVLLVVGSIFVIPRFGVLRFEAYTFGLVAVLLIVCWRTGEPPRWRWGDDERF